MLAKQLQGAALATQPVFIEDTFSSYLYTGNGSTQTITNDIDLSGKGGLVWLKGRSGATHHALYDTARGATFDLVSNLASAQTTQSTGLTAFNSNGFSLGALAKLNTNAATYASWTFRKQAKFFDVVTYTGDGVAGRTVAHNLGSVVGCMIIKRTDTTGDWFVYHRGATNPSGQRLLLNSTAALASSATYWNNTSPTSTEFTLGTNAAVNANGGTYVAYLFAHDAGGFGAAGTDNVISCGATGGGNTAVINLGWEPQLLIYKSSTVSDNWHIIDNMRGASIDSSGNGVWKELQANLSDAESSITGSTGNPNVRFVSNGFQIGAINGTAIYIAIRRPMKTPTSGTQVFTPIKTGSGSTLSDSYSSIGFPIDMTLRYQTGTDTTAGYKNAVYTRLLGINSGTADTPTSANNPNLLTHSTAAEVTTWYFSQTGSMGLNYGGSWSAPAYILTHLHFRRAPGFFDVVCYTGTGSPTSVKHNLGVVPELIITKRRDSAYDWVVYSQTLGTTKVLFLNTTDAEVTFTGFGNVTSTNFDAYSVVQNGNQVAYLFATVAGVSKVGSYTGTGTTQTINCGFTAGSRFVMIKRTDSTGDWLVADTARGLVSGNDPLLRLNSTAAEVTTLDWIDPDNSGFVINQETTANANVNNATYIFLAIA
jgi:hypothetical protein